MIALQKNIIIGSEILSECK